MPDPTPKEMQKEEVTELRQELQKLILPILVTHINGTVTCIGTGFLIAANGRRALMVTAAHNMDCVRKIEDPYPAHHPTTPDFFRLEKHRFELHKTKPRAMYCHSGSEAHKALIEASVEMPKADLALCSLRFEDDVPGDVQFQTRLAIDTSPVRVNEPIIVIGYPEMKSNVIPKSDNIIEVTFGARWYSPIGKVTAVYSDEGPRTAKHPCFSLNVSIPHGLVAALS
jgi:hypothetical protein